MIKKVLLGCSALLVLAVIGIAVVVMTVSWNSDGSGGAKGADSEKLALSQDLENEFGGRPQVEFVCLLPVVGIAPCVLNNDMGSRETTLTFTNYEPPEGVVEEEQARRIAILAFQTSQFARESDKTDVVFDETKGSGSASVSRRYSFSGDELAVGESGVLPGRTE